MTTKGQDNKDESSDDAHSVEKAHISVSAGKVFNRIGATAELVGTGKLSINESGLHFHSVDEASAAGVDITIPFGNYNNVPEPFEVAIDIKEFSQAVGTVANRHDEVEFTYGYGNDSLYAHIGQDIITVPELEDPEKKRTLELEMPSHDRDEFTASVEITSFKLAGVVAGIGHSCTKNDAIALVTREEEFAVARQTNGQSYTNEWTPPEDGIRSIESDSDSEIVGLYGNSYLEQVVRALPAEWTVTVNYAEEFPLHVEVVDDWRFFVAPRICVDNHENDEGGRVEETAEAQAVAGCEQDDVADQEARAEGLTALQDYRREGI